MPRGRSRRSAALGERNASHGASADIGSAPAQLSAAAAGPLRGESCRRFGGGRVPPAAPPGRAGARSAGCQCTARSGGRPPAPIDLACSLRVERASL